MKKLRSPLWIGLLILLGGCVFPTNPETFTLIGRVEHPDSKPVSGVTVVVVEKADRSWTFVPKGDRRIGEAVTDEDGRFVLQATATTRKRLSLVALGAVHRIQVAPQTVAVEGTDVAAKAVRFDGPNVIVVPDDFVPAKSSR